MRPDREDLMIFGGAILGAAVVIYAPALLAVFL